MIQQLIERCDVRSIEELSPNLSAGEVHAWVIDLAQCSKSGLIDTTVLSAEESARANRFKTPGLRTNYIASHWALRTLLGKYLQISPEKIQFTKTKFGKPFLDQSINPPDSALFFNLAHSEYVAFIGLLRGGPIGVDIELRKRESIEPGVAEKFFSIRELREYHALDREKQAEVFFNCWTRKEAYLKAVGCGLVDEVKSVEMEILPAKQPTLLTGLGQPLDIWGRWTVFSLEPFPGFSGAVVAENSKSNRLKWGRLDFA